MNFDIDYSLTTFTSDGKLEQCDNAYRAASKGTLSIGCTSTDGVVLASLKLYSKLVDISKIYKVNKVCDTIGMTYSGLNPDYRVVYETACVLVESYFEIYGRYPYLDIFVNNLSRKIQENTMLGGKRPYGVVLLVAGYIKDTPCLFRIEPTGSFERIEIGAIGKDSENAAKFVKSRKEMLDDNIVTVTKACKEFSGSSITFNEVDIGVLKEGKFEILKRGGVKEIFDLLVHK